MTPAERMRLDHIASRHRLAPKPTADDVRLLLYELDRMEAALESVLWTAAREAAERALAQRQGS